VAFTEDLSQFFEEDDFAVQSVIKTAAGETVRTISVIFNTPTQEVAVFDTGVESNLPLVQCLTSDLDGVTKSHTMAINAVDYRISDREDDGTGISTVQLRKI
jgi:hypothetical protein